MRLILCGGDVGNETVRVLDAWHRFDDPEYLAAVEGLAGPPVAQRQQVREGGANIGGDIIRLVFGGLDPNRNNEVRVDGAVE